VGSDADVKLMAEIAKEGRGRGYVALDPQTIPQIFTTETLLISRDLLIEKTLTPTIVASSGPLKGIAQANLPPLRGYVLTYPKPRSELLMRVDKDPLLGLLALRPRPGDGIHVRLERPLGQRLGQLAELSSMGEPDQPRHAEKGSRLEGAHGF
jgi:hypothetical protein